MKLYLVFVGDWYGEGLLTGVLESRESAQQLTQEILQENKGVEVYTQEWGVGEICGPFTPEKASGNESPK